jgi:hypothetical protein
MSNYVSNSQAPSRMRGRHSRDRRRRSFSGRSARPVCWPRPLPAIHRQRVSAPPAEGHVQQRQRQDESRPQTATVSVALDKPTEDSETPSALPCRAGRNSERRPCQKSTEKHPTIKLHQPPPYHTGQNRLLLHPHLCDKSAEDPNRLCPTIKHHIRPCSRPQ